MAAPSTTEKPLAEAASAPATRPFNDRLIEAACKMLEDGARARQVRFEQIKKNEDMYFGVNPAALKGRSNIPFDQIVMGGFIDTLLAQTREGVLVNYGPSREQDRISADKITAAFERESAPDRGAWLDKFQDSKLMAALAGVSFQKLYFKSAPRFKSDLITVDHYDMVVEALGGSDIDKHLYKFQQNIYRDRTELMGGVKEGIYDVGQVRKLLVKYTDPTLQKAAQDLYNQKVARYAAFGIDILSTGYVGQNMYRLTEGVVYFEGKWWYMVFSYETKVWVRVEPLEAVFEHAKEYTGRGPWSAWQTHRHPFLFWTKAPADDVRPVAYTMKKVVNYTIDGLEKRTWQQRAYDPKVFTDPAQLLWRQDGLVRATLKQGQQIGNGIFEFTTPDTTAITVNLVSWLDQFVGQKTGISPDAQGVAKTDNASVLVQNLQQVSKRMMLSNDMFRKHVVALGVMFDYGCYEYIREPYAIKLLGPKGARWDESITRKDTDKDFTITVKPADEEEQKSAIAATKRANGFISLEKNPAMMQKLNPNWYLRERLRDMGYDQEQIRVALDANNDGDSDVLAEAAQAISDCLEGKELYRMYRNATSAFVQKILDFCADSFELIPAPQLAKLSPSERRRYARDMAKHDLLIKYAQAHIPIAQQNMIRKATSVVASGVMRPQPPAGGAAAPAVPPATVPGAGAPTPAMPVA